MSTWTYRHSKRRGRVAISEELFRKTVAAAYDLHRHRDSTTYPACLVRVVAQTVRCDSALLVTVNVARREFRCVAWPSDPFDQLDSDQVTRLHATEHPFVAHCATSRSIRPCRLSDLAPRLQFLRTELYRTIYKFLGIEHQLLMLVASPGANWSAVALNRRSDDFSDEEQLVLEALWPHFMLAQRNLRRGLRPRDAGEIGIAAAEQHGAIVITSAGAVTLCSEQSRIWLAEYFDAVFLARGVALPAAVSQWVAKRMEGERRGRRLRVARRDPLIVTRGERCLVLNLIVDYGKDMHLVTLEEVILNAPTARLEALGLTPRESEVLTWVAQGKTNREVGIILGASARTVQKHLEHMFQKMGVESRTAAILRAWQVGRYAALAASDATRPSNPR